MKPSAFRVLLTLAIAFIALASSGRAQFVYVANFGDSTLWGYSIATNGALTPVPGSPYPAGSKPTQLVVDQNKFVYILTGNGSGYIYTIVGYSIAPDGALSTIPGSPFPTVMNPLNMTVDPLGRFLFVPCSQGFAVYSIGSNGALTPVPGSPFKARETPPPHYLAVDPSGTFAFVPHGYNPVVHTIWVYQIESTGALKPLSQYSTAREPGNLVVDPNGKFLYVTGFNIRERVDTVSAFQITSKGSLKHLGSPYREHSDGPASIAVDPTGKFVFVNQGNQNTVSGYRIASNGELKPVSNSTFPTGDFPGALGIDPTGQFFYVTLYVPNGPGAISGNVIGANGELTAVPGSPFATGNSPDSIAITSQ